jgi:hypothetical protein
MSGDRGGQYLEHSFQSRDPESIELYLKFWWTGNNLSGLKHSAGQLRFKGRKAENDAEAVKLMRASGAIPLLVTSTPELCMMIETYNKVIGTTNNPYDLRRTPSGSSGGEVRMNHTLLAIWNRLCWGSSVTGLHSIGVTKIREAYPPHTNTNTHYWNTFLFLKQN